jgi:anthranilate phosphoribosyltransferase
MIRETIERLLRREDLTRDEAAALMNAIVSGELSDAQIAAVLIGLLVKGETVDEIAGFVDTMRAKALRVTPSRNTLVDTCGTGGDGTHTFNISTAAALVAAGAGVNIAKHGNRAQSSRCGSSDVLEALGIETVPPDRVAQVIDEAGIGFMFAPAHHPALKQAGGVRRELGVRTVFNLLGPMANPAFVRRQLVGVFDPALTETVARVLASLGSEHVYVVHGADGSDEVSIAGESRVTTLRDGRIETTTFAPESAGLPRASTRELTGGTPDENARTILAILEGATGAKRNAVILNAGFVICAGGRADTIEDGVRMAAEAIDDGRARRVIDTLRRVTAGVAADVTGDRP